MTENEKIFVKAVVDYDANIATMQDEIKEKFNVDSEYVDATSTLILKGTSIDKIAAKEYINENFTNCFAILD